MAKRKQYLMLGMVIVVSRFTLMTTAIPHLLPPEVGTDIVLHLRDASLWVTVILDAMMKLQHYSHGRLSV